VRDRPKTRISGGRGDLRLGGESRWPLFWSGTGRTSRSTATESGFPPEARADIRGCFREIGAFEPDVSVYLPQMAAKKAPDLIRTKGGYRLERAVRAEFDSKYGQTPATVVVTKLLSELPASATADFHMTKG
jgi:hypothetical protein